MQKDYSWDKRKTVLNKQHHFISERQLVPFEERLVIFSYIKSKNKINNYLTINSPSYLEPTNIPSQGKELRTRGEVWAVTRVNRRDDIWFFTNFGRVYLMNFFRFMGVNKTVNLDEEYFVRDKGEEVSYIRPLECFVSFLKVEENLEAELLLIVSKTGKIRVWRLSNLLNKIGKSGKQLLTQKRLVLRCPKHQKEVGEHQKKLTILVEYCVKN